MVRTESRKNSKIVKKSTEPKTAFGDRISSLLEPQKKNWHDPMSNKNPNFIFVLWKCSLNFSPTGSDYQLWQNKNHRSNHSTWRNVPNFDPNLGASLLFSQRYYFIGYYSAASHRLRFSVQNSPYAVEVKHITLSSFRCCKYQKT